MVRQYALWLIPEKFSLLHCNSSAELSMFWLELLLERHLSWCQIQSRIGRSSSSSTGHHWRHLGQTWVDETATGSDWERVELIISGEFTATTSSCSSWHWDLSQSVATVGRVTITGVGVTHPAGAGEPRPVWPAHGALAGPGGGAWSEAVGLWLFVCSRVVNIVRLKMTFNVSSAIFCIYPPSPPQYLHQTTCYLGLLLVSVENFFIVDHFVSGNNEFWLGVPLMIGDIISETTKLSIAIVPEGRWISISLMIRDLNLDQTVADSTESLKVTEVYLVWSQIHCWPLVKNL